MSRILVTGGAGFIGSHVVDKLIAAGHEPRILDVRPSPYRDDVETVVGDMCVLDDVLRAAEGCDAIAHLAAAADVGEVQQDPVLAEQLNARGTVNVLEAARQHGVSRVVYASTIWVYSDVEAEHVDEGTALLPPAHLYTATKLAGELYCRSYRELFNVESTILRFGIPYGPRARPAAVIPIFVRKALAGEPLTLAGGGLQTRRFVYVEDLADGVIAGLAPCAANRTYNLVSGEDVTIRQIAEHVRDAIGNVELVETEGRAGDFKGAEVCGKRAAAELAWTAKTPFAEGLRRYVAWHREHVGVEAPVVAEPARARRRLPHISARRVARDAALVLLGLFGALLAALVASAADVVWDGTADISHFARGHLVLSAFVACLLAAAIGAGRRAVATRA